MYIMNSLVDLWQTFNYGLLKKRPSIDFSEMPDQLSFISHYDKENDVHWLEVPDLPEFIVTGKNTDELARNFTDTLLTYFDVPRYFAKRYNPDRIILKIVNQKTGEQETIDTLYKEEIDKVLA